MRTLNKNNSSEQQTKRRILKCQEEMEQDREARALEQVAEWAKVKAGGVEAKAVVQVKAVEA